MVHNPSEQEFGDYADWSGRPALDRDGTTLGEIEEIFLDTETRLPEWVLVRFADAGGHRLVPLAGARIEGETLRLDHDRERVLSAPDVGGTGPIPQEQEGELYRHYGLDYSHEGSGTGLPADPVEAQPPAQDATADIAAVAAPGPIAAPPEPGPAVSEPLAPAPVEDATAQAPRLRRVETPAADPPPGSDLDREQAREDLAVAPGAAGEPSDATPAVDFAFPDTAAAAGSRTTPDPKLLAGGGAALLVVLLFLLRRWRA